MALSLEDFCACHVSNQSWLAPFFRAEGQCEFPYQPVNKIGQLIAAQKIFFGEHSAVVPQKPYYVACVPYYVGKGEQSKISDFIRKIADEAFSSKTAGKDRLELILYANRMQSPDPAENTLEEWFNSQKSRFKMPCTLYAGYWALDWDIKGTMKYEVAKRLLRIWSPTKAKLAFAALRVRTTALRPMQRIRQAMLHSPEVTAAINRVANQSLFYHVSFDRDTAHFSAVLSSFDILAAPEKRVLTTGYAGSESAPELTRAQMALDKAVRIAMLESGFIPYIPEPCMGLAMKTPREQRSYSYVTDGGLLEAHALLSQSSVKPAEIVFSTSPALVTEAPERMVTKYATKLVLTNSSRFARDTLTALRGKAQTHTAPRNWCQAVFWQLSERSNSQAFFSLMNDVLKWTSALSFIPRTVEGRWSDAAARATLPLYPAWHASLTTLLVDGEETNLTEAQQVHADAATAAVAELLDAGYTDDDVEKLIKAALATGWAEYQFLENWAQLP